VPRAVVTHPQLLTFARADSGMAGQSRGHPAVAFPRLYNLASMAGGVKPHGIEIKTHWGESWEMPEASKEVARQLMTTA
jgi:hypothetical protein